MQKVPRDGKDWCTYIRGLATFLDDWAAKVTETVILEFGMAALVLWLETVSA